LRHLPNLISVVRLLAGPGIAWLLLAGEREWVAPLCLAAGLTDLLDGFLARRLGLASHTGAYLDPIADKIFVGCVVLAMAWTGLLPAWLVALMIGRDVLILAGGMWLRSRTGEKNFPPSILGKLSTFFQISAAMTSLAAVLAFLRPLAIVLAALFTVVSGLDYLRRGWKIVRRH
jgi:cardiolipin synthase